MPDQAQSLGGVRPDRPEGSRLTDLAATNVTPQSTGQIVDELESMGYVVRRPDPADRRAKLIQLTPAGQKVCRAPRT